MLHVVALTKQPEVLGMDSVARKPRKKRYGVVRAGDVYSADEFCKRAGICLATLNQHRRCGLRVARIGKRLYVHGAEWVRFLETQMGAE
jgi:hypothetical protein